MHFFFTRDLRADFSVISFFWCVMLSQNNDKTATLCKKFNTFLPLRLSWFWVFMLMLSVEIKCRFLKFFWVIFAIFIELKFSSLSLSRRMRFFIVSWINWLLVSLTIIRYNFLYNKNEFHQHQHIFHSPHDFFLDTENFLLFMKNEKFTSYQFLLCIVNCELWGATRKTFSLCKWVRRKKRHCNKNC